MRARWSEMERKRRWDLECAILVYSRSVRDTKQDWMPVRHLTSASRRTAHLKYSSPCLQTLFRSSKSQHHRSCITQSLIVLNELSELYGEWDMGRVGGTDDMRRVRGIWEKRADRPEGWQLKVRAGERCRDSTIQGRERRCGGILKEVYKSKFE